MFDKLTVIPQDHGGQLGAGDAVERLHRAVKIAADDLVLDRPRHGVARKERDLIEVLAGLDGVAGLNGGRTAHAIEQNGEFLAGDRIFRAEAAVLIAVDDAALLCPELWTDISP